MQEIPSSGSYGARLGLRLATKSAAAVPPGVRECRWGPQSPANLRRPILRTAVLGIAMAVFLFTSVRADPVPDSVVHELWDLIDATAETGRCPDRERLVELLGSHGIWFLEESHEKEVRRNFDVFAPILASSQAPPYVPDPALQEFYRANADEFERWLMLTALREWLSAEITEAPRRGSMRLDGPPEALDGPIDLTRSYAAEMIADWHDDGADSLMADLEKNGDLTEEALWRVRRARGRLVDPCAMSFLRVGSDGDCECCKTFSDIGHVSAGRGGWRYHKEAYRLSQEEVKAVWALIPGCRLGKNSKWAGNLHTVVFEFEDGVKASMSPTEAGRLVYRDNTMLDMGRWLTLENKDLYALVWEVLEERLGADGP